MTPDRNPPGPCHRPITFAGVVSCKIELIVAADSLGPLLAASSAGTHAPWASHITRFRAGGITCTAGVTSLLVRPFDRSFTASVSLAQRPWLGR
jgi:hypothetical protein